MFIETFIEVFFFMFVPGMLIWMVLGLLGVKFEAGLPFWKHTRVGVLCVGTFSAFVSASAAIMEAVGLMPFMIGYAVLMSITVATSYILTSRWVKRW